MSNVKFSGTMAEIKKKFDKSICSFVERVSTWYEHTNEYTVYDIEYKKHNAYDTISVKPQVNSSSQVNFVTDKTKTNE